MSDFQDLNDTIFSESKKRARILPIDRRRADKLRKYLGSVGKEISPNKNNWAQPFAVLRRCYKVDGADSEIDKVLDFLITNNIKRPNIRHGRDFYRHYEWLQDIMENTVVAIPKEDAKRIWADIKELGWPSKIKAHMPGIIQESLDNVRQLYSRLRAKKEVYDKEIVVNKKEGIYKSHPKRWKMTTAWNGLHVYQTEFVKNYLKWLHAKLSRWKTFSWQPKLLVFQKDNGFGEEYGYNFPHWKFIIEETKDE